MSEFRFKQFSVQNDRSALKVGTDAVLLGAAMTILPSDARMLDIGTGTGVIALMAAQRHPDALIEAIDIDGPSAEEAAVNFAASPWPTRLCARHTALADYTPDTPFDLIFANPPYYDSSLKNPDVRSATARHTDSLSYREICSFAANFLNLSCSRAADNLKKERESLAKRRPDLVFGATAPKINPAKQGAKIGRLSMILPADNEKMLIRTAAGFGLYPFRLLRIRSTARKKFSRIIAEFSLQRTDSIAEEELTLMNEKGGRSEGYTHLTSDFYL